MRTSFAGYVIFFLVTALTLGINLAVHLLDMLQLGDNYLLLSVIAVAMAGLLVHRKAFFLVMVVVLSVLINLPEEQLLIWNVDRVALLATLLAVIILPLFYRQIGLESDS